MPDIIEMNAITEMDRIAENGNYPRLARLESTIKMNGKDTIHHMWECQIPTYEASVNSYRAIQQSH